MADAGAKEIADLLDGKSARLAKGAQRMVGGFERQKADPDAHVPARARSGLHDVADYYTDLRREIQKVHTGNKDAKKAVVAALSRLSIAFEKFGPGLKGSAVDHTDELQEGAKLAKRAAADLRKARQLL